MTGLKMFASALVIAVAAPLTAAHAQATPVIETLSGTKLDITATGEVTRVPDLAIITAGVVTRSATAVGAIEENARKMEQVRAALKKAGIADRDIQTSSINLNPDYAYENNQPPRLTGYQASNNLSVRFRDIKSSGKILDALVAQGANQISGPNLTIDKPETALDEARTKAVAEGRARADLYARALGMRVVRLLSVSENAGYSQPVMMFRTMAAAAPPAPPRPESDVVPGEQQLQVTLSMSFELR